MRVSLPPLRSRRDLAQAVQWVLHEVDATATITDEATARLARHAWPGNFRELRSVLTRALLMQPAADHGQPLRADDVARVLPAAQPSLAGGSVLQRSAAELVRAEYERTGRSVSQTSRNLAISRTTVYKHLRS